MENNDEPIREGWVCPLCESGVSPDVEICPCGIDTIIWACDDYPIEFEGSQN